VGEGVVAVEEGASVERGELRVRLGGPVEAAAGREEGLEVAALQLVATAAAVRA